MGKRMALLDIDMDYKAAADEGEPPSHYVPFYMQDVLPTKVAEGKRLSAPSPRMVSAIVQILDLALDPKKADEVIGDLLEQYPRRLAFGPGHAKRWLVAQIGWVLFGRAPDVIRQVAAARAGK